MRSICLSLISFLAACGSCTDGTGANHETPVHDGGMVDGSIDMGADEQDACVADACGRDDCANCGEGSECIDGACVAICGDDSYCPTADGFACCGADTGCFFEACVDLFDTCDDDNPCPFTQFCEPTVGRCIDIDADPNACIYAPPVGDFDPVEAYGWSGSTDSPTFDQVMMMPVVANLTDDNADGAVDENDIPDILFTTFAGSGYTSPGVLRAISGDDGREHFSSMSLPVPFDVHGSAIPAVGDIDQDGLPEIIIEAGTAGGVYALEHDGTIKWNVATVTGNAHGGPSIANINGAGPPEIVTSMNVLSATGERICDFAERSIVPAIADLDMDGTQEIVLGTAIYNLVDATATDGSGCVGYSIGIGGWPAIANLDDDPNPEIVVAEDGALVMLEHDGTEVWRFDLPLDQPRINTLFGIADCTPAGVCTTDDECGAPARCFRGACIPNKACHPGGGPPTIADFDGDRQAEIGIAGRWYYLVFEADGSPVWAHKTQDFSSAQTGSSVFDFEGDGRAEVVYNDEQFLRVYSGVGRSADDDGDGFNDPDILLEVENSSGTLMEYPLIVDVDNDGSAEIVVMANNYSTAGSTTKGLRVFKDADNNWVGTRRIWNQHTYHVTNIEEDASVPVAEVANWTLSWLNNYRQNVQGGNPLNAPNFVPIIDEVDGVNCATAGLVIRFTVQNIGSIGVRAGALDTTVFAGETGTTLMAITTVTNTTPLGPGGSESFEVTWAPPEALIGKGIDVEVITDYADDGSGRHNECIEDDNATSLPNTVCMVPQ